MKNNQYLVIHGHFYQPPRESPWLDIIEQQHEAAPYHDWNEKIFHECYKPNAMARILNEDLFIEEIVNNFEYLSFNIGPTLLCWLREKHPDILQKIIAADARSLNSHNGHGNAIAQVYNHIIMPLALPRDQVTQVKWGIQAFEYFFRRKPEGMWLAETAVNYEVLDTLIDHGIRFTILSPFQADAIKPLNTSSAQWQKVKLGSVPSHKPYRIFSRSQKGKYIDVFFYHPQIARDFAFSDSVFHDAHNLREELLQHVPTSLSDPYLLNIAVDGETFGHHTPFADMCLSYYFRKVNREFQVTNYGEFLELYPPREEVKLYLGEDGKGSSWSCIHGVGRWERDCGCRADQSYTGNHKWRTILRNGLDKIHEYLWQNYSQGVRSFSADPLALRNEYISCRIDAHNDNKKEQFLKKNIPEIPAEEHVRLFSLLEAQYYSQLMFTSCGWFFDDPGQIEPVQNLKYALKALEQDARWFPCDYKKMMNSNFSIIYSVIKNMKGGELLKALVYSASLSPEQQAACVPLIIDAADKIKIKQMVSIGSFKRATINKQLSVPALFSENLGLLFLFSNTLTGESRNYMTINWWDSKDLDFILFVAPTEKKSDVIQKILQDMTVEIELEPNQDRMNTARQLLGKHFPGGKFLALSDISEEFVMSFLHRLIMRQVKEYAPSADHYIQYLEKFRKIFGKCEIPVSRIDKHYIDSLLKTHLFALCDSHELTLSLFNSALQSLSEFHIRPDQEIIQGCFQELFAACAEHFSSLSENKIHEMITTLKQMRKAGIAPQQTILQDSFYEYIRSYEEKYLNTPLYYLRDKCHLQRIESLLELAALLSIAVPGLAEIHKRLSQ